MSSCKYWWVLKFGNSQHNLQPCQSFLLYGRILSYAQTVPIEYCIRNDDKSVVTASLFPGDSQEEKFVKRADVWFQRDVLQREIGWPKGSEISRAIDLSHLEEAVRFVTIIPKLWDSSFNVTLKIKKRVMSGAKKTVGETMSPAVEFVLSSYTQDHGVLAITDFVVWLRDWCIVFTVSHCSIGLAVKH